MTAASNEHPVADVDNNQSQTLKALLGLRGMITVGALTPGQRVSELQLVDRLGVSRTPARAAMLQLREEGLLESGPSGGFTVSAFTEADVFDAIEIRGTLEGLAARFGAERGVPGNVLAELKECLSELDKVIGSLEELTGMQQFVSLNDRFHNLLVECGQSTMVTRSLQRVSALPFAAPHVFVDAVKVGAESVVIELRRNLVQGHAQHHALVEAIQNREGSRAQAIALEHARAAWKYLRLVIESREIRSRVPALSLVRP